MHELTKGNPDAFRLNSSIIHFETTRSVDDTLKAIGWSMEFAKIHSGAIEIRNDIDEIVAICKQYGVNPFIGGGLLEDADSPTKMNRVATGIQKLGIDTVEVSDSQGTLSKQQFQDFVRSVRKDFNVLLVEIGAKEDEKAKKVDRWREQLDIALTEGADRIIFEGSGNGKSGIYEDNGRPKTLLVHTLLKQAKDARTNVIIEAPKREQAGYWLDCGALDWNTRFGNVAMDTLDHTSLTKRRIMVSAPEAMKEVEVRQKRYDEVFALIDDRFKDKISTDSGIGKRIRSMVQRAKREGAKISYEELMNHSLAAGVCLCTNEGLGELKDDIRRAADGKYNDAFRRSGGPVMIRIGRDGFMTQD